MTPGEDSRDWSGAMQADEQSRNLRSRNFRIAGKPAATPWIQRSPNRSLILTGVIYSLRYGKVRTFAIPFPATGFRMGVP